MLATPVPPTAMVVNLQILTSDVVTSARLRWLEDVNVGTTELARF